MRLLVDFHHHALAESMILLFENRFGVDVYFPAGKDWFDSGIWRFGSSFLGDQLANQYLTGIWSDTEAIDGCYLKDDIRHPNRIIRGITLDAARNMKWDYVISTLPENDEGFRRFANEYGGAAFGIQVGNYAQNSRFDLADFIMLSAVVPGYEDPAKWGKQFEWNGKPSIIYHQEFNADTIFFADTMPAISSRTVGSFVNCFPQSPEYHGWVKNLALRYSSEFDWKIYGSYGNVEVDELAGGNIWYVPDIASAMRSTRIGMHIKPFDGYGHVIHNFAAVGRPVIWTRSGYSGQMAGPLWEDGVTAWDIASLREDELIGIIRRLRDDNEFWLETCQKIRKRFAEFVSFSSEASEIAKMLGIVTSNNQDK